MLAESYETATSNILPSLTYNYLRALLLIIAPNGTQLFDYPKWPLSIGKEIMR